jgi:large subunit ribosomal protein L9
LEVLVKVVFLQDVPHVAVAGEVKEVADGYGRNFLLPKKLAVLATPSALKMVEVDRRADALRRARSDAELARLSQALEGTQVVLKAHAGTQDRLFGSITSADIARELHSQRGMDIDKRRIELEEPIRHLGSYEVPIRLAGDMIPKITVIVEQEEG